MSLPQLPKSILDALTGLTVQKLYDLGIKGSKRSPWSCPVARYLESLGFEVSVTPDHIRLPRDGGKAYANPVAKLVIDFDSGMYPELDNNSN